MTSLPKEPSPGDKVTATMMRDVIRSIRERTPIKGPGMKISTGPNGTVFSCESSKKKTSGAETPHPWKVYGMTKTGEVDHCFEIVVPYGCVMVGDSEAEIEGLTETENGSERYVLDCESDISSGTLLYLVIYRDETEEEEAWKAIVCTDASVSEYEDVSVSVLMLAKLTVDETTECNQFGKVDAQYAHSSICIRGSDEDEDKETAPSPFMISVTVTEDELTGEPVVTHSVENRNFYWDGELKTIASPHVISSSDTAVWLVATQTAPSSSGEQTWTFALSNTQGQAESGGRVVNYKLYDLDAFEVTCDYRTTFMDLSSPHKVAKFTVEKYDSSDHPSVSLEAFSGNDAKVEANDGQGQTATLKATGSTAKLELTGSDNSVTLDPANLSQGNDVRFHTLTVNHADGTSDEYDVLADDDIEIQDASGEVITDVEIELNGTTLRLVKTYTDLSDGTTRTARSSGITVKNVDVLTSSQYANMSFVNNKKQLTVLDADSSETTVGTPVFTAVAHSTNS